MVDLDRMMVAAGMIRNAGGTFDDALLADMLDDAATELAAHRAASPLPSGPSVAERLVAYRCASMPLVSWASGEGGNERSSVRVEAMAHAMLAAERGPGNG